MPVVLTLPAFFFLSYERVWQHNWHSGLRGGQASFELLKITNSVFQLTATHCHCVAFWPLFGCNTVTPGRLRSCSLKIKIKSSLEVTSVHCRCLGYNVSNANTTQAFLPSFFPVLAWATFSCTFCTSSYQPGGPPYYLFISFTLPLLLPFYLSTFGLI